jgi:hypothetical protein
MSLLGHTELEMPWPEFYSKASLSSDIYLVKTHLPPRDDQPAIYVVRDGRSAIMSYFHYHRRFLPEVKRSLIELVLGCDYYGGWSTHYVSWSPFRRGRTLIVRYEDLVSGADAVICRIAEFIEYSGPLRSGQTRSSRFTG